MKRILCAKFAVCVETTLHVFSDYSNVLPFMALFVLLIFSCHKKSVIKFCFTGITNNDREAEELAQPECGQKQIIRYSC